MSTVHLSHPAWLSALALVIAAPAVTPVAAQDGPPPYVEVTTYEVAPAQQAAWDDGVKKIVEAAQAAELPERFGWDVYQGDSQYYVVSFHESMAEFDDPEAWMRAFEGTPGESLLMEAFAALEDVGLGAHTEVIRTRPDWSFVPASPRVGAGEEEGVFVIVERVKFGQMEAWEANTGEIMRLLAEIGYPYAVHANQVLIGEGGAVHLVIPHDGLANFYGPHSVDAHLEMHGRTEAWGRILSERMGMLDRTETFTAAYRPDLTYRPGM